MGLYDMFQKAAHERNLEKYDKDLARYQTEQKRPANVAKAYGEINQALAKDEDQLEKDYYNTQTSRGQSPVPEHKRPQDYEGPTAIERYKKQIDAMVGSSNPVLQAEGLKQLIKYQDSQSKGPADNRTNNMKLATERFPNNAGARMRYFDDLNKTAEDRNFASAKAGGSPAAQGTKQEWLDRSGKVTRNMQVYNPDAPFNINDIDKLRDPQKRKVKDIPLGISNRQLADQGYTLAAPSSVPTADEGERMASTANLIDMAGQMRVILASDDTGPVSDLLTAWRSAGGVFGAGTDLFLDTFGIDVSVANRAKNTLFQAYLTTYGKAIYGANISEKETARLESMLPGPGQSKKTQLANLYITERNLRYLQARREYFRQRGYDPDDPNLPTFEEDDNAPQMSHFAIPIPDNQLDYTFDLMPEGDIIETLSGKVYKKGPNGERLVPKR